jgi:phosphoribosylformylglycinamidine synthase subunit PurL
VRGAVRDGRVRSAHDVAEGGLAVALAECCVAGGLGAVVEDTGFDVFAEAPGRAFVVSGAEESLTAVPGARVIGRVAGDRLSIGSLLDVPLGELRSARSGGLGL